jgi:hypothetical protein
LLPNFLASSPLQKAHCRDCFAAKASELKRVREICKGAETTLYLRFGNYVLPVDVIDAAQKAGRVEKCFPHAFFERSGRSTAGFFGRDFE